MKMVVKNNKIILKNIVYTEEDLQTEAFYAYANDNISHYQDEKESVFQNEIYNVFVLRILAVVFFIQTNGIDEADISKANRDIACVVEDAASITKIKCRYKKNIIRKLLWHIKNRFLLFSSFAYLVLTEMNVKYNKREVDVKKKFSVTRSKQGMKRIVKVYSAGEINLFEENGIGKGSFYEFYKKSYRLKELAAAFGDARSCIRGIKQYCDALNIRAMQSYIMEFYYRRIVHTCFFSRLLEQLFAAYDWKGEYITEKNLDRFALIEEKIAQKSSIQIICIPHGLEYGYLLPHMFTGNKFYTTSRYSSEYLNKIYSTNKFIYSEQIARKMFECNGATEEKKIVYFSEPRDAYVNINIMDALLEKLQEIDVKLYIKHHPKDIMSDYNKYSGIVEEITDFDTAITGNICIARKSTILLEALYNSSKAIAIITNNKDKAVFELFPALKDDSIVKTYNIEELFQAIKENM